MKIKNLHFFFILGILSIFLFISSGCNLTEDISDDSSKEAELERGLNALDESNYEEARKIFEGLKNKYPSDNSFKAYYSNSLAGLAGLDTYNLMKAIDDLDKKGETGDTIGIVGRTLTGASSDETPSMTENEIVSKKEAFENAINALLEIAQKDYDTLAEAKTPGKTPSSRTILSTSINSEDLAKLTNDELVQLGLMALNHGILIIGDMIIIDAPESEISFSKNSFKTMYNANKPFDTEDISKKLKKLSLDIELINNAIYAINNYLNSGSDEENDISEEFELFKTDLDNGQGGAIALDNYIAETELEYYLLNL
jgi:hypothetical protein